MTTINLIPNDILNPLWDEDEKEKEEEVGGRVADELQERLPHHLIVMVMMMVMMMMVMMIKRKIRMLMMPGKWQSWSHKSKGKAGQCQHYASTSSLKICSFMIF